MQQLITQWVVRKAALRAAQEALLETELKLYELTKDKLREKGVTHFEGGLDITAGFTESWDNETLDVVLSEWPGTAPRPFTKTWKPDSRALAVVRAQYPELNKRLEKALTVKPRKPSFGVKNHA